MEAKPVDDTRLMVAFDNGVKGVFDCRPYMDNRYWECLKTPSFFRQVRVDCGTLCWPNDVDIDPEEVWDDCIRL